MIDKIEALLFSLEFEVFANTYSKGFFRKRGEETNFTIVSFYIKDNQFYTEHGELINNQFEAFLHIVDKLEWKQ